MEEMITIEMPIQYLNDLIEILTNARDNASAEIESKKQQLGVNEIPRDNSYESFLRNTPIEQ